MGRGGSAYISYLALVLLSPVALAASATTTTSVCIWCFDIDNGPAPPPDQEPPFSRYATRNKALLPYQIVGILAAYVGVLLFIGTLLLTLGRRLRLRAQSTSSPQVEMIKPAYIAFDPSPVSPSSRGSWYKLRNKKSATSSLNSENAASPGMDSVASFDNKVIESDRLKRQVEMEMLYAAVMEHDENEQEQPQGHDPFADPSQTPGNAPLRLMTDARHLQAPAPDSPGLHTPRSPVRAIYPPHSEIPEGPVSPTSPIRAQYPKNFFPQAQQPSSDAEPGHRREHSSNSNKSMPLTPSSGRFRRSIRNLQISAPLQKDDNSDGARTPLSPRFYTDPGIPPEPPTPRGADVHLPVDNYSRLPVYSRSDSSRERIDEVRAIPRPYPQRTGSNSTPDLAQSRSGNATKAGSLPFREMNRQYAATQRQQQDYGITAQGAGYTRSAGNLNSPGFAYATSAGPVKTTFVESRRDLLGSGPRTAVPYSPYMPFTPVTPVTPRLTTRAERKQRKREERAIHGPITEEDAVEDERDMWDSGY